MPQMAPMNWLLLFLLFSIMFVMFNILNYFSFDLNFKINNSNKKILNNKNPNKNKNFILNWKW
uniref:ATP synthase complex subunit 8 n=1 Tax=Diptera sp. 69 LC-2017 TaxID=2030347 RepID=A0A343LA20_9DIPT|nr:ATP synthase F0 subunit 8 [Diptera sp. 69 LC-2017]